MPELQETRPVTGGRVLAHQRAHGAAEQEDQRPTGHQHVEPAHQQVAFQVHMQVVGHAAVLHFFGTVPAQQVEHHRVGGVQAGSGDDPVAQHAGEMLHGGDQPDPLAQPPGLQAAGEGVLAQGVVAEHLLEQPVDALGEGRGVDAVALQVRHQGAVVGAGVLRLLAHEAAYVLLQALVGDQRQGLVVDPAEPELPGRQDQVQGVHDVRGLRLAGDPVQRGVGEVEAHLALFQAVMLVAHRVVLRRKGSGVRAGATARGRSATGRR
ncbi:hypothetical protein FQZ97_551480 [compost metagenome]